MAAITERKRKDGARAYIIRFYRDGKRESVSFDSGFTRQEVELCAAMIDAAIDAERRGEIPSRAVRSYFENASVDLQRRLADCGLVEIKKFVTLADAWRRFNDEKNQELSESTRRTFHSISTRLFSLFDEKRQVRSITELEAKKSRNILLTRYAEATTSLTITCFRAFWRWCVDNDYADKNIYANVKKCGTVDRSKDFQIPREWTSEILDACPSQCWRTAFALWRVGGLRKKEVFYLTWDCVNWEKKRLLVRSPKTARYEGRESRVLPLFPVLERELGRSFELCPIGEKRVIWENFSLSTDYQFEKIVFQAGYKPWVKIFQNMRASAENDLVEAGFPPHVVGAWIGHTGTVQERHYLRVMESYYDAATSERENTLDNEGYCQNRRFTRVA